MLKPTLIATVFSILAASVAAQTAPPSRAEVLADLEIYRLSGLGVYDRPESPDFGSPAYLIAKKRYEDLRKSPKYAELVRAYVGRLGETVEASQQAASSASGK